MTNSPLILASSSPQRAELLSGLGWTFRVQPSNIDESTCREKDPVTRARILARKKAEDVGGSCPGGIIIGCDTLVVAPDSSLLEKPLGASDARRMIELQSGKTSVVHSALCVIGADGELREGVSSSRVTFARLTEEEIDWWIETDLWRGRSGAFQIDGKGQLLIEHIEGDWTGIVGLPIYLLGRMLPTCSSSTGSSS